MVYAEKLGSEKKRRCSLSHRILRCSSCPCAYIRIRILAQLKSLPETIVRKPGILAFSGMLAADFQCLASLTFLLVDRTLQQDLVFLAFSGMLATDISSGDPAV